MASGYAPGKYAEHEQEVEHAADDVEAGVFGAEQVQPAGRQLHGLLWRRVHGGAAVLHGGIRPLVGGSAGRGAGSGSGSRRLLREVTVQLPRSFRPVGSLLKVVVQSLRRAGAVAGNVGLSVDGGRGLGSRVVAALQLGTCATMASQTLLNENHRLTKTNVQATPGCRSDQYFFKTNAFARQASLAVARESDGHDGLQLIGS